MKKIVALTISVHYSDKLPYIIHNLQHLDKWYFVIDRKDAATVNFLQEQQQQNPKIHLLFFDSFFSGFSSFNKSGAVRFGQEFVHQRHPDEWILLLDSDIVLPKKFSSVMEKVELDPALLYGCRRYDYRCAYHLKIGFGVPYTHLKSQHFVGYFQLYFRKDAWYHPKSENCSECDVVFLETYFPRKKRGLLPLKVKHLGYASVNGNGRKEALWEVG